LPQVLTGAIRTALLKQRGALNGINATPEALARILAEVAVRGPLIFDHKTQRPLIPCPADLVGVDKAKHGAASVERFLRLAPLISSDLPGWSECRPKQTPCLRPLWNLEATRTRDQTARLRAWHTQPGWLTWSGFLAWVAGGTPAPTDHVPAKEIFDSESRTQVGMDTGTNIAAESVLFTTRYLRMQPRFGLYAEIDGADDLVASSVLALTLGGDRRLCVGRKTTPVSWPTRPPGPAVCLALTPTILPERGATWPTELSSHLAGCGVLGSDAISGWDLAKNSGLGQPKPTRYACRSGSVWHLTTGTTPPPRLGSDQALGFGWLAHGTWFDPHAP